MTTSFPRIKAISSLYLLMIALILGQIFRLQFISGEKLLSLAVDQKEEILYPERGLIVDRWGHLLATNEKVYEVGVNLVTARKWGNADTILATMYEVLGGRDPYIEAVRIWSKGEFTSYGDILAAGLAVPNGQYVRLTDGVSEADKLVLETRQDELYLAQENSRKFNKALTIEGLEFRPHLMREYPEGTLAANIIGFYTTPQQANQLMGEGVFGIEEFYNSMLAGTALQVKENLDPRQNTEIPEARDGATLILTIDREIQAMLENVLDRALTSSGAGSGTIIVLDPETGEVLGMASTPHFNPNEYGNLLETFPGKTPYNKGIGEFYEPGSVFKVITMAVALDLGVVTPETTMNDTGSFGDGSYIIYNWDRAAHGTVTMQRCMELSLNVCLATVAVNFIGSGDVYYKYLRDFGFDRRTNIDLAGELYWPLYTPVEESVQAMMAYNSFGQGLSTTAIQMASAISAVANDGIMMAPHVLKGYVKDGVQYNISPQIVSQPISAGTAHTLTAMLQASLYAETETALVDGYSVAGKTGTAEIVIPGEGYTSSLTNASFVGWGPTEDPKFIVYVWLDRPTKSPWGSVVAAPVFREVVENLVVLMNIPPDSIRLALE